MPRRLALGALALLLACDESPPVQEEDGVVAECIADEFERWTFPKPRGGGKIQVEYPLRLDPE